MSNVVPIRALRVTAEDRRRWDAGELVPFQISTALDLAGQEGPEVDVALGGAEPMVDLWEAGELYPSWSQLGKLAELTGFPIAFFFKPVDLRQWYEIRRSMFVCDRSSRGRHDPRPEMPRHMPVTEFTKRAISERKR